MVNFSFSGSETKQKGEQTLRLPAPTAGEEELRQLNLELAKEQLASLREGRATETTRAASPLATLQSQIEEKATANILALLTGQAPVLTPEEQSRLDLIYGTAQKTGEEDLMRFGQEIAGQRGMTVGDSPIGNELLRQRRLFGENITAQKSASALDLGNAEAAFNANIANFQNQLRQQAFTNRLAIAGLNPASYGLQSQLFGERLQAAPRSFSGSGSQFGWGAGGNTGSAGELLRGYGAYTAGGGWQGLSGA